MTFIDSNHLNLNKAADVHFVAEDAGTLSCTIDELGTQAAITGIRSEINAYQQWELCLSLPVEDVEPKRS